MSKSRLARYYFRMFGFGSAVAISGTFSIISALVLSPLGLGMHVNSVLGHVFSILGKLVIES